MKKKKIAILLPYKDHFTHKKAGSASIWVKDFNRKSKYKNQLVIFGNTSHLEDVIDKKKYTNLDFNKLNFSSKNISYVKEFIKNTMQNRFEIIEIHNRPNYLDFFKGKVGTDIKIDAKFHYGSNGSTLSL